MPLDSVDSIVGGDGGALVLPDSSRIVLKRNGREIPAADPDCQRRLSGLGGRNLYGLPNFRIVWGWSRMETLYSRRTGNYDRRPRYWNQKDRYILEAWHPPLTSRQKWERETRAFDGQKWIDLLGPYPSQGDYESMGYFETAKDEFLQPTPRLCEVMLDMAKLSKGVHHSARRDFLLGVEVKKETDFDSDADAAISDAGRPFGGNYFVPVTGPSPDHWPKNKAHRFNPS